MSLYTTLVFVALAALGALIAYLGDLIGARVGKQRSSIFGLRPRQSARLVAAIIGGMLPLLGLGVATVGSRYARAAVFELRSLVDQRKELESRIDSLQQRVNRYEKRTTAAEARAEEAEEAAAELKSIQKQQQERIEGLRAREDELQDRAAALEDRAESLDQRVGSLTERRDELETDLTEAREDLQASHASLREAENNLDVTEEELKEKRKEVAEKEKLVEVIELQYDNVQDQLESANRELDRTVSELTTTSDELAERERELAKMEARLQHMVRQQDLVSRSAEGLFEPGYELLRVVQPADQTQDQMEADLQEWLHLASAVAERRGVPEGPSGRAVVLVAPIPEGTKPGEVTEAEIIHDVARKLRTEGPDEWVVMVRAFRRFFPEFDAQVSVHFQATPNELAFSKGAVLDEFLLSPPGEAEQTSELEAIQALWHRVADDDSPVRARAISEGMLPRPNSDSYGSIDLASIYEAAQKITAISGDALVQLRAAQDTYTRGPLELRIEVQPAGERS